MSWAARTSSTPSKSRRVTPEALRHLADRTGLDDINAACRDVLKANDFTTDYLRPVAYRSLGGFGLSADTPTELRDCVLPAVRGWRFPEPVGGPVTVQVPLSFARSN